MSLLLIVPFVLMLLAIALLPLVAPPLVGIATPTKPSWPSLWGYLVAGYLTPAREAGWCTVSSTTLLEYAEFMVLMGSLYTISGGIALRGDLQATSSGESSVSLVSGPSWRVSWAQLAPRCCLIRPLLQTNAERRNVAHTGGVLYFSCQ